MSVIQGRRGLNAPALAKILETHERTIYRDIDTLNASGVPCHFDEESNGYRVARGFYMPPVELTFEEAMSIVALLEEIGEGSQIPFFGIASRAAEKLRSQLSATVQTSIEPIDGHVHIDLARSADDDSCRDVYDDVRDAIAHRRVLRCVYESARGKDESPSNDQAEFDLHPYALWFCQRAWYVIGHHGGRDAVRQLKLNRFTFVRPTERPLVIPDDFDIRTHLGNAWRMIRGDTSHRIAVRFDAAFADNASETRWHPTQEEEWDHDTGAVTLRFTVDGLDEIVWWILGYGPNITILEPPELIERVRQLAQATAERYTKKKT